MRSVAGLNDFGSKARTQVRVDGLELRVGHVPSAIIGYLRALRDADAESLAQLLAPDIHIDDGRRDPLIRIESADVLRGAVQLMADTDFEVRLIAVRGDLVALVRFILKDDADVRSDALVAVRCNEAGQVAALRVFDVAQHNEAIEALRAFHKAIVPEAEAHVLEVTGWLVAAMVSRDFEALERVLTPDMRHVDHRDADHLTLTRDEVIAALGSVLDADADLIDVVTEVHAVTARGVVASVTQATRETLGLTDPEISVVTVRGDQIDLAEFYDEEDLGLALERLRDLTTRAQQRPDS